MLKRYQTAAYALVFLVLIAFLLGWKFMVARERPEDVAGYRKQIEVTAANVLSLPTSPESTDESLRIYGVNVVHTPPFKSMYIAYGIYLGDGAVLTAAHTLGKLSGYTNPRVLIAGQDLPAKVVKEGSVEKNDLALVSVDQERLPISLRMRRNPQCKDPLRLGTNVVVVYPERIAHSRVISPMLIPADLRSKFNTLIDESQVSGSGVFDAGRKCLLGIMSRRITKFAYQNENGLLTSRENGYAGYFVPVFRSSPFIPQQFRF